jgi:hypothetical protein
MKTYIGGTNDETNSSTELAKGSPTLTDSHLRLGENPEIID